ncbi:MAG: DUF4430 domain-containing protein, partial [Bdellovibrio sp.]
MRLSVLFLNIVILISSSYSKAMSFEIIGKNARSIYSQILTGDFKTKSVGEFTLAALSEAQQKGVLNFNASVESIVSINGLGSDLDIVSDKKMKAYGWCYTVNGKIGEKYPHQAYLNSGTDKIVWYYGYALYDDGQW